ncbi:MRPL32 [Cordylochernes scorpioides]|uniref:MRPL32 n=1 Tax=Cordylochernes scorpioides TaxID=51811 RepID=A0ABY6K974_9ARAC|nr:MRPL32 [Cordylochernes scorpioides]
MPNSALPRSPGSAGQKPGRPSIPPPTGSENLAKNEFYREIYKENSNTQEYANPPADSGNVNLAAARVDVTSGSAATLSSNSAALAIRNWADHDEDMNPGTDNDFTIVKTKKRRRESSNSPTAAAPSSNSGGARSSRRLHSSARSVPRAQEIPTTRTHITEARARQASSSEEHCVYLEHGPELQPFHYLRALDRLLGGTAGIIQISKVNGHQLLGLANRGLAERLINNGLEVEGTLLRAFPFRKRAERITVGNLPFFVEDSAIIKALGPYGRITSIAPKMMKAGPYTYTDGRREAFIVLHEGVTTERLPTRLNITIKGEAWPAYLSSGIKCSRCHGQGHRKANCPLLAERTTAPGQATPTSPTSVPPATAPRLPQQPSAQPPPPASPSPTMEVSDVPPTSRAALHPPAALRQSSPAPSALPAEDAPPAPPPVTPAPSLRTPGSREPAAPTPDVEMSIVEETSASSTSTAKNATRIALDAFIERHPSVSFAETDALGLGREEVLDLLSSRTKTQRSVPLLPPSQCDALAGLIRQILDLRPGAASNLYKVLGQVKAELRTTPAAVPTPPAPRPAEPAPPAPHGEKTTPDMATPPPPLSPRFIDERWKEAHDIIDALGREPYSEHLSELRLSEGDITDAIICPEDREPLLRRLSTRRKNLLAEIISPAVERARDIHPFARHDNPGHDNPGHDNHGHDNHGHDNPGSSGSAGQEPGRPSIPSPTGVKISSKNGNEKIISKENSENRVYANPPTGVRNANLAAACGDVTTGSAAATSSNGAARVLGSWADSIEDQGPGEDDDFTVVKNKKRRRDSPGSPTAATSSSGTRGAGTTRRPRSSTGWAPRAEEVRTTRAHIAEARARQASSTEDHCVFLERSPELEPYHYMRAIDRMFGSTREVFQVTKMNGHFLVGLANRGMAERLINEGLEVEGTLHRAFPFRKRAERITVGNLPFFVGDAAVISALSSFGRVTSIAPKLMKAGPYIYNDGRREAFIILREGMTIERLPTRLDITIKGEAWPAYLSSGIRCSRCRGQGHRRANCPLLARRNTAPGPATPTSPTSVPPATAPRLPQQPSAQPPPPASPSPTMEVSDVPPTSRAALHPPAALRQSPPAPSALPAEDAPLAPPPVTPAPSLRTPGSREPAAPTPDVEMSIAEETSASSTSSLKNATKVDLDAFIEKHPSVSFAGTDALGLGREEVLDLLSSRTKAQRKGPLLSPPQCVALARLIGQILDLRPGAASNLYKVLGQVKAELRTTPVAVPTPPPPAPRPAETTSPALHGERTSPDIATPPPPLSCQFIDDRWTEADDILHELNQERDWGVGISESDITEAVIYPEDREPLIRRLSTRRRSLLAGYISAAIERARDSDPFVRHDNPGNEIPGHDNPGHDNPGHDNPGGTLHDFACHPCAGAMIILAMIIMVGRSRRLLLLEVVLLVKEETMKMREAILKSLGLEANDKEVAVLYKGEKADNRPNTRFVELPEERPPWFTDNLLEPSNPNKDLK